MKHLFFARGCLIALLISTLVLFQCKKEDSGSDSDSTEVVSEDDGGDEDTPPPAGDSGDSGDTTGDDPSTDTDGGETDTTDGPDPSINISGSMSVAIFSTDELTVESFEINDDGTRGESLGVGTITGTGDFNIEVPVGTPPMTIAISQDTTLSLRNTLDTTQTELCVPVIDLSEDVTTSISSASTLGCKFLSEVAGQGNVDLAGGFDIAKKMVNYVLGISNFSDGLHDFDSGTPVDPLSSDTQNAFVDMFLKEWSSDIGGTYDQFMSAIALDVAPYNDTFTFSGDGTGICLDGWDKDNNEVKVNDVAINTEGSFALTLLKYARRTILNNPGLGVGFNHIYNQESSCISLEDLKNFTPQNNDYESHTDWIEILPGTGVDDTYESYTDCMGPFVLKRFNEFYLPEVSTRDVVLNISDTAGQAGSKVYTDAGCVTESVTKEVTLPNGSGQVEFYYTMGTYFPGSLIAYGDTDTLVLNVGPDLKAQLSDGTPIANGLSFSVIDDVSLYPDTHSLVTTVNTGTCHPAVVELWNGGNLGAARPSIVTLNPFFSVGAPELIEGIYSDNNCLSGLPNVQVPAEASSQFFYIKFQNTGTDTLNSNVTPSSFLHPVNYNTVFGPGITVN